MTKSSAFDFQQFTIEQDQCAMKVGIDSVLLGAWTPIFDYKHILDIGTGTGILSLMMAQRTNAVIDAIDINFEAFHQANENFSNSVFNDRIKCHHSSLQVFNPPCQYDLIICNPPYFESSLKSHNTHRNLARHNDSLSLNDLFSHAYQHLNRDGRMAIILPYSEMNKAVSIAQKYQLYNTKITQIKGKEHKNPNRVLILFQRENIEPSFEQITVYNKNDKYTNGFKKLTQEFYLPSIFR